MVIVRLNCRANSSGLGKSSSTGSEAASASAISGGASAYLSSEPIRLFVDHPSFSPAARPDDPHGLVPACEANRKHATGGLAEQEVSLLPAAAVPAIRSGDPPGIQPSLHRFGEAHSVLLLVLGILERVPLEVPVSR